MKKKMMKEPPAKAKKRGYAQGGRVTAGSPSLKPTNQTTMKARGSGAATKGNSFKV